MLPTVALIGRRNVGKSTLFNRLIRKQKALTHDRPGVTRDRLYAEVPHGEPPFALVDTGGLVLDESDGVEADVFEQAREAMEGAQLILFVVDGRQGVSTIDEQLAAFLRQTDKPVRLVINKVDGAELEDTLSAEFYALGFPLSAVSAAHGYGTLTLQEEIEETLQGLGAVPVEEGEQEDDITLRLALLGRPNVGKSSLINALVGEKRLVVSPEAGTTTDIVDVLFEKKGKRYIFLDSAGVRRRSKIDDSLERFSVLRALRNSKRAQVTVLCLDALQGVVGQDKKLLSFLDREKIPFIVAVNKVDLVPSDRLGQLKKYFENELRFLSHVPRIYTSAVSKAGLGGLLPLTEKLWSECTTRIGTGQLNRGLEDMIGRHQPPVVKHRRAKFYYLTQTGTTPPTFVFFVNDKNLVKPSYARYLEKQLRKRFQLRMTPIQLYFRTSRG
ncbi:ribosome biogenesis GTPase Der [Desulfohalobium retbaense]|uniref:GTPase Der n=1 Tax=Desulfohalobium retbaense (strain ATCC 49708 / DSM 5692 / JCM 16813 / HR100) TaxID=485915 RepID=C8X0H6_DESRD|nr:ribosome biogenesis GTPase Der [Desulfohalobium retbaense]ACV67801.1 ribosome-associated GTPase EngA [Desulfohalobium retbaense DSM 5692]